MSRLTKTGHHSNGYWFVGSKNSSIKISDSKGYPKVQDIAKDAGVLDAFQKGNVTIDFYPDMLPNTYTLTFDYGKRLLLQPSQRPLPMTAYMEHCQIHSVLAGHLKDGIQRQTEAAML